MAIVVNGKRIEDSEIDAEVERLRPHYELHVRQQDASGEAGDEQLREWARENLVERALVCQAARAMDVEVPSEEIDAAYEQAKDQAGDAEPEAVKADIELQMRVDRLMAENVGGVPEPAEQELRQHYDEHREELTTPEQVRASHIVKHVHGPADKKPAFEAIMEAKMALAEGASFEDVASKGSDCPERAGDLGVFARGQMVPEFEEVVFGLQVGQVSDVFETSYGYHIAKLYERRAARTAPFEQVKGHIAEELCNQRRQEAIEAFVDSLKEKATIEEAAP